MNRGSCTGGSDQDHPQEKKRQNGCLFSSVQFSHSVVSSSLQPHRLQCARPLCPSPSPGVYPNSCPSSRWCNPTISSSVNPFSSRRQSFPASGSFHMSQFFSSCGQSIGTSASASLLSMNIQDWSPLGWTVTKGKCSECLCWFLGVCSGEFVCQVYLWPYVYLHVSVFSPYLSLGSMGSRSSKKKKKVCNIVCRTDGHGMWVYSFHEILRGIWIPPPQF